MLDLKKYAAPEVKLNSQTVRTFDEKIKPNYKFDVYEPEIGVNLTQQFRQSILAKVIDAQECVSIEAIRIWAKEKGYDDVILMDESKLKEIIKLGSAEYERLHGGR